MYIISKFESFSNDPGINDIKDIFQYLVDKWDMVFEGDSNCIGYNFFLKKEDIDSYHKYINIGKEIENIENVYLIIHCDLSGRNDFYTTLYEFNNDCENLLKRFQSEFNCQLLTAYGSQYLQSKGIQTSRFLFIFRRELNLESFKKRNILDILPTYKKLSNDEISHLNDEYITLVDILQEIFDDFNISKINDIDFNTNYIRSSEDKEYSIWFFEYGPGHKKARGCDIPNINDKSEMYKSHTVPQITSIGINHIPYPYSENLNQILNSDIKKRIESLSGRSLTIDKTHHLDNYIDFSISLSREPLGILENLSNIRIKSRSDLSIDDYYQYLYFNILKWNTEIGKFEIKIEFDKNEDNIYNIEYDNFDIAIYGFEIYDQYKSKGLGKFSFGKIIEYIENNFSKYRNIYLSVYSNNIIAIKIYEYYGFSKIEDDGGIIVMKK